MDPTAEGGLRRACVAAWWWHSPGRSADLAAHWSLTALVTQRVILLLVVAPLLLLGLPYDVIQWLTRPPAVDAVLVRLHRPPVAIVTVTVLVIGSMTPAMVRAQSSSRWPAACWRWSSWSPVWSCGFRCSGGFRASCGSKPVVRFGYLVVQAVVPAFLSFIFIFSRHPLYAEFARSHAAIGLRPLNDQQMAGFVSKLSMLFVLLIVGRGGAGPGPDDPRRSSARTTRWCGPTSSGSSSGPTVGTTRRGEPGAGRGTLRRTGPVRTRPGVTESPDGRSTRALTRSLHGTMPQPAKEQSLAHRSTGIRSMGR